MSGRWASGEFGKVIAGGRTLDIKGWKDSEAGKVNDVTNTGGGGVEQSKVGTKKYSGSFRGVWDLDNQLQDNSDDTPGLYVGQVVQLDLFYSLEAYKRYAQVEIQKCDVESEVDGMVTYAVEWQSQVAPTYPGETAYSESSSGSSSSDSASSSSSLGG